MYRRPKTVEVGGVGGAGIQTGEGGVQGIHCRQCNENVKIYIYKKREIRRRESLETGEPEKGNGGGNRV